MKLNLTTYGVGFEKILLAPTRRPDRRHQSVPDTSCASAAPYNGERSDPERIQFDLQ
jgi:hypothetical protein